MNWFIDNEYNRLLQVIVWYSTNHGVVVAQVTERVNHYKSGKVGGLIPNSSCAHVSALDLQIASSVEYMYGKNVKLYKSIFQINVN